MGDLDKYNGNQTAPRRKRSTLRIQPELIGQFADQVPWNDIAKLLQNAVPTDSRLVMVMFSHILRVQDFIARDNFF